MPFYIISSIFLSLFNFTSRCPLSFFNESMCQYYSSFIIEKYNTLEISVPTLARNSKIPKLFSIVLTKYYMVFLPYCQISYFNLHRHINKPVVNATCKQHHHANRADDRQHKAYYRCNHTGSCYCIVILLCLF